MHAARHSSYGRSAITILVFGLIAIASVSCSTPTPESVTSVRISEGNQTLLPGDAVELSASVDVQGSAVDTVTLSSSAPSTAKIDQDGLLAAVAPERADITATSEFGPDKHDSVEVTVLDPAEPLWVRQFGTAGLDYANGVAIGASDKITIAARTFGDFEGTNAGGYDAVVLTYRPGLWRRRLPTAHLVGAGGAGAGLTGLGADEFKHAHSSASLQPPPRH